MKSNPLVCQRFQELAEQAKAIRPSDGSAYLKWATSTLSLLQRIFGPESVHYRYFSHSIENCSVYESCETQFSTSLSVFEAAREDYKGGYLFNTQSLVRAEVFDDVLEQARALLSAGYKDPACVVAGVALEAALRGLCSQQAPVIPHGKLDKMNADLAKAGVYNVGMQKQITSWADRRNNAAHGKWTEYTEADVEDIIRGVTRLIADYV